MQRCKLHKNPVNIKTTAHRTTEVRTCGYSSKMKDEIAAAVVFLTGIVRRNNTLNQEQLAKFSDNLAVTLIEKYRNHWYEDKPKKGQAFRCIRVSCEEARDTVLLKVARKSGLKYSHLGLPVDLTLWVDPNDVSCRFGEKGTIGAVAVFSRKSTSSPVNVQESSSTGSSPVSSDSESDTETTASNVNVMNNAFRGINIHENSTYQYRRLASRPQYVAPRSKALYVSSSTYHMQERHNNWKASQDQYRWVNNSVAMMKA